MGNNAKKAILISVSLKKNYKRNNEFLNSLKELHSLSKTNLFHVYDDVHFKVDRFHAKFLLNTGNMEKLKKIIKENHIDTAVFDNQLTPAQIRNLEKEWDIGIMDRTDLILEIFEKHAVTKESVLQIELAKYQMILPRLSRMWTHLDRQTGGIGMGGAEGEKQIERDRREIQKKISQIKTKLKKVEKNRQVQLKRRENSFRIALVGYTNAGKSTLINKLTNSDVYADDKLFATLDPRTKKWDIPVKKDTLITDTIGFIRRLPHHLVATFKSTLYEADYADLIWHVIDASHEDYMKHEEVVLKTLEEIGIKNKTIWKIYNKCDCLGDVSYIEESDSIYISALKGEGVDYLKEKTINHIREKE